MSKVFYDHLVSIETVELHIGKFSHSKEEKEELWQIIDEMLHHKVLGCILDHLPSQHHQEFLERFHLTPHDEQLIEYLQERIQDDVEKIVKQQVQIMTKQILEEIKTK